MHSQRNVTVVVVVAVAALTVAGFGNFEHFVFVVQTYFGSAQSLIAPCSVRDSACSLENPFDIAALGLANRSSL